MPLDLTAERARVFRILHRANLPWVLANGLHCANADIRDPNFVAIGNQDLIDRRRTRQLPQPFETTTLSDYVPFYFTPCSPMMLNIKTGYNGVAKRMNEEILILVSSFDRLEEQGVQTIFSDRHAYLKTANFFSERAALVGLAWDRWQVRDFKRDPDDPGKFERYEAECLASNHVPVQALLGIGCYNDAAKALAEAVVKASGLEIPVRTLPGWYF